MAASHTIKWNALCLGHYALTQTIMLGIASNCTETGVREPGGGARGAIAPHFLFQWMDMPVPPINLAITRHINIFAPPQEKNRSRAPATETIGSGIA